MTKDAFLNMFPQFKGLEECIGNSADALVLEASCDFEQNCMTLWMLFTDTPSQGLIYELKCAIKEKYGLDEVFIHVRLPHEAEVIDDEILYGSPIKGVPVSIKDALDQEGEVIVTGQVISNESRIIQRANAAVLKFDMTDGHHSITVSRFLPGNEDYLVTGRIDPGMYLTVYGMVETSIYSGEPEMEPYSIQMASVQPQRSDMAPVKRVELHLHTKMSTMDAVTDPAAVVERARNWGMNAIAITDHGAVQAFPAVSRAAKGIKVIYGMEGYYENDIDGAPGVHHISLLVLNKTGLKNLYELVSRSYLDNYRTVPTIPKSLLMEHKEGLLVGSACEKGELFEAVEQRVGKEKLERLAAFYDYLEIMPCAVPVEKPQEVNRQIVAIGERLGKPVCATGDVHYLDPGDEASRAVLLRIQGDPDYDTERQQYFRTTEEMLEEFSYLGAEAAYKVVVTNTNLVADMVEGQVDLLPPLRLYPPKIDNSADQLKELVNGRLRELYGEYPAQAILDRVEREMEAILHHGFDVVYMAAQKVAADSLAHGYSLSSRGGVGSSLVAYLAGITDVNSLPAHYLCPECHCADFESGEIVSCGVDMPDKLCPKCGCLLHKEGFDVPFATFVGIKGDRPPDIDLDLDDRYRDVAVEYIKKLFGEDRVVHAGTVATFGDRIAYGYVEKYSMDEGLDLNQAEMKRLAMRMNGVKRTTGQYPGGLFVIPQDMEVTDFTPVQHPEGGNNKDVITTHVDYNYLWNYLLKLDVLTNENVTMLNMMERLSGVNAKDIRLDDPETLSLFTSPKALGIPDDDPIIGEAGLLGIPEFYTEYMQQMLKVVKPVKFGQIVRMIGFSRGVGVWLGNAMELIQSGIRVDDTISCRDDIMLYLIKKGVDEDTAFQTMENVRKPNRILAGEQIAAMRRCDVPKWYIDSCQKIEYVIPKTHAVVVAQTVFRLAWYKVHRPMAFYTALFRCHSNKGLLDIELVKGGVQKVRDKIHEIQENSYKYSRADKMLSIFGAAYEFYIRGFDTSSIQCSE